VESDAAYEGNYGLKFSNEFALRGSLSGGAASITNPIVASGSVALEKGDLIIAVLGEQTALTVTAVTDNLGNSYTAQNAGTDAGTVSGRMFRAIAAARGTLTSVSFAATASADDASCVAAVFRGPFENIDINAANVTNDTTNPLSSNSTGTLSTGRQLAVGWIAGAFSTSGLDTASGFSVAASQRQSTAIETMISYKVVSDNSALTADFTGAGTIGNNVIGVATFYCSQFPYVQTTTGHNLSEAILRFRVKASGVAANGSILGGMANSSNVNLIELSLSNDRDIFVKNVAGGGTQYSTNVNMTGDAFHFFELRVKVGSGDGEIEIRFDGETIFFKKNLTINNGNIDRAFIESRLSDSGSTYFFDNFELLELVLIDPVIVYTADKLYLQNASVNDGEVTADIVGWDFMQRVWPTERADQNNFPGLFR
jgi:hypothetical protein